MTERETGVETTATNGQPVPSPAEERDGSAVATEEVPQEYQASIYTAPNPTVPAEFASAVQSLEERLNMRVWLLIQAGEGRYDELSEPIRGAFFGARESIPEGEKIALVIDSPGGSAKSAYQLATFLRRRCGGFVAVVPRYAKSAATLLALGADQIILGDSAELGPLDAQLFDPEREQYGSALDEAQALERLHAFALDAFDQTMFLMLNRTGKKIDTLIDPSLNFAVEMTRPLLANLDTVHYTQVSRVLKVAEEYAVRLLRPNYPDEQAQRIARHLVENYPDHSFVIDGEEATGFGLRTVKPSADQIEIVDTLATQLAGLTVIGRIQEVAKDDR